MLVLQGVARLPIFSSASVMGRTIHVSGILGTQPVPASGGPAVLVEGGLRAETKQIMQHIETILKACAPSFVV